MDSIIASLLNLGVGGIMAAAVIMFLYHLLQKTIPDLLAEHRHQLVEKRTEYLAALERQQSAFERVLHEQQERHEVAIDALCTRLDSLAEAIRDESREMASLRASMARQIVDKERHSKVET